jgi:hypothetical protein
MLRHRIMTTNPTLQRHNERHGVPGRPLGGSLLALALALVGSSCVADTQPVPVDPGLTFAAHEVHAGLVIDRTTHGGTGIATPAAGLHFFEAALVLRTDGTSDRELRITGPGRVVVERRTPEPGPAELGLVEPSWVNNAIRLTLRPADGPPVQSGRFHRVDQDAGLSVLTRNDQDRIDLEGAYRATLRAPDGRDVGWLSLVVGKSQPGHVMYEGVLPPEIDDGMATAAAEALGSEIAYIESTSRGVSRKSEER